MGGRASILLLMLSGLALPARATDSGGGQIEALERQLASSVGARRIQLLDQLAEATSEKDFVRALGYASEAARLATASGDERALARASYHEGKVKALMGRTDEAKPPMDRALALARKTGDRRTVGDAVNGLGLIEYRRGRFRDAAEQFAQALAIWEELGEGKRQATALSNLGSVHCQLGDAGCGGYFERALAMQRKLGDRKGEALALGNLAIARQRSGEYAAAVEAFLEAMRLEEALGNPLGVARACGNLAIVYKNLEQHAKALEYQQRALALHRAVGDRHSVASDLDNLGAMYADQRRYAEAIAAYQESLALAERMGEVSIARSALHNLAEAEEHFGRRANAHRYYGRALAMAEATGAPREVVAPLLGLARLEARSGNAAGARSRLAQARSAAGENADREILRDIHASAAETYAAIGDFRHAYDAHVSYATETAAIQQKQATDRIAEMEARFAAEKKAREIELLKRDNEIQALRLRGERTTRYALVGGLLAMLALLFALWLRYRHLLAFWRSRSHVGAYRILREIGSGAMGVVYKAVHVRDRSRPVAIKVIRQELSQDPVFRQRLRNEGALIDQIDHPNIVRVYERGESDQRLYIVMEWLDGRSLAEVLRAGERLPLEECLVIMSQLAGAVAQIHSRGIVHRDLKPENVMLVREAEVTRVKLLDFDVARAGSQTRLTETGVVVGTVAYLAPERITRQAALPESDVFALGVVFYELLTLERPFFGENAAEVVRHILEGEPLPPLSLRPELPAALAGLLQRMLHKDPAARATDADVACGLAALAGGGPSPA